MGVEVWSQVSRPLCLSIFKRNTFLRGHSLDDKCLEDHQGVALPIKLRCWHCSGRGQSLMVVPIAVLAAKMEVQEGR